MATGDESELITEPPPLTGETKAPSYDLSNRDSTLAELNARLARLEVPQRKDIESISEEEGKCSFNQGNEQNVEGTAQKEDGQNDLSNTTRIDTGKDIFNQDNEQNVQETTTKKGQCGGSTPQTDSAFDKTTPDGKTPDKIRIPFSKKYRAPSVETIPESIFNDLSNTSRMDKGKDIFTQDNEQSLQDATPTKGQNGGSRKRTRHPDSLWAEDTSDENTSDQFWIPFSAHSVEKKPESILGTSEPADIPIAKDNEEGSSKARNLGVPSSNKPSNNVRETRCVNYSASRKILSPLDPLLPSFIGIEQLLKEATTIANIRQELGEFRWMPLDERFQLSSEEELSTDVVAKAACFAQELSDSSKGWSLTVCDRGEGGNTSRWALREHTVGGMNTLSRPELWSRFIWCQGLSQWALSQDDPDDDFPACAFFTNRHTIEDRDEVRSEMKFAIQLHIRCAGRSKGNHYLNKQTTLFHVTGYKVCEKFLSLSTLAPGSQCGSLYGAEEDKWLTHRSYTIYAMPDPGFIKSTPRVALPLLVPYYTLLLLLPAGYVEENRHSFEKYGSAMQWRVLDILSKIYDDIADDWATIHGHMNRMLDDGDVLFHPGKHDDLFDDEIYSRSRRYFWAITALEKFERTLTDTIEQWKNYRTACIDPIMNELYLKFDESKSSYRVESPNDLILLIESSVEELEMICQQLNNMRTRTEKLRGALFSASGVIESRAATQLGENVKLLTYVSIFYLPLAFCTSLWSINTMFGLSTFGYVAIIVALATYFIVFNLNNMVAFARRGHEIFKKKSIRRMQRDANPKWRRRAKEFEQFQPKRTKMKPSNWLLLFHLCLWLTGFQREMQDADKREVMEQDSMSAMSATGFRALGTSLKNRFHLSFRRFGRRDSHYNESLED